MTITVQEFNKKLAQFQEEKRSYLYDDDTDKHYERINKAIKEYKEEVFKSFGWKLFELKESNWRESHIIGQDIWLPDNIRFSFSFDGGRFNAYVENFEVVDIMSYEEESAGLEFVDGKFLTFFDEANKPTTITKEDQPNLDRLSFEVSPNFYSINVNGFYVVHNVNPSGDFSVELE